MNRKVVAIGAIVVVAAAVAFWWSRHAAEPAQPAEAETTKSAVTQPAGAAPARRGEVDLSARVMIDDDPKGSLQLEGQVIDADDHPVKGALVAIAANPPRTTQTQDDGSFTFDGLVGRPYTVIARAPGGIAGPVTAKLTAKSDPIVLKLRAAAKLTVTVTAGGKPLDGATVELRGIDEQREVTRNGIAVVKPVAPGGYQVAAWADGMARTFQWIQIGSGDAEIKLSLASGASVTGRVVDDHGTAVAGAHVRYSGVSDWSQQGSDRLDGAISGANGSFKLDALPAGTFRFLASHPERAPGSSPLVTLDGRTARDGVTITLAAGAVVRGTVVDGDKRPVASARVRIGVTANPRAMIFEAPRQAYTDAAGVFEIKGVPRKPLSAVALHDSGASQLTAVDASAGDVTGVTLAIDVTGVISGIVVDPKGQAMEGIQVSAGPSFSDNRTPMDFSQWRLRGFPQELTDAAGKFTLTGLAPGSYMISAMQPASRGRRGPGVGDGISAKTGDTNLRLVLPPEGAIKGKVAFADGSAPGAYTISVGMTGQSFTDGEFLLDALPPQKYEVTVRGPSFQTRALELVVESGKTADAGTITVVKGRTIGGTVVADGKPVAGAQVHVGRLVFGNGSTSNAQFGPMGASTKHDTTDANGAFQLSGFGDGDITIVAEHEALGRSRAMRLPTVLPGQTELTLTLEHFGSLSGVLRQAGKPVEGVFVSCQSTTTPGAIYSVASGPDGSYRFDALAPDVYKVSATVGMPMTGMRFYSKQIEVPSGRQVTIDLAVEPGTVTLDVTVVPKLGKLGVANVYVASGAITAKTASELALKMAAAGPGASQWVIVRNGEPARFGEVAAGAYSVCVVPFPSEVRGMGAMGYAERHGDTLAAFCKPVTVAPAPDAQTAQIPVELPPFIQDTPPGGGSGGSGSGSGSGSGG